MPDSADSSAPTLTRAEANASDTTWNERHTLEPPPPHTHTHTHTLSHTRITSRQITSRCPAHAGTLGLAVAGGGSGGIVAAAVIAPAIARAVCVTAMRICISRVGRPIRHMQTAMPSVIDCVCVWAAPLDIWKPLCLP